MMRKLPTIGDEWTNFAARVIPLDADQFQRQEMRRAFYAGASVIITLNIEIGSDAISDEEGIATLESLQREMMDFVADLKAGRA